MRKLFPRAFSLPGDCYALAMSSTPSARLFWGLAGLLTALVLLTYLPAYGSGFVWDDDYYVSANPTLRDLAGLRSIWLDVFATPQYYPLVHTSFWLEYRLVGASPHLYHFTNVVLHAANALLLWRIVVHLGVPGAWLIAAVFALHPVQVESVAWITERKNVLSAFFYLAAALTYLRFSAQADSGVRRWRLYSGSFLLYLAALLSKTVSASLPAALLLILWWKRGSILRRDWMTLAPMLLFGAAFGLLTVWLEREHVLARGPEWDLSLLERGLIAGRALWFYAAKLAWPQDLAFIYPRWAIDPGLWWQYLFPLAAIAVVCALFLLRRRLGRGPVTAVLLFAGTLFPALGFFNIYPMRYSFVANHFQYLACIGLIALAVGALARRIEEANLQRSASIMAVMPMLAVLAALSWWNTLAYVDMEGLWRDTLEKNPQAWMAHHNLGIELDRQGRHADARKHFQAAVDLKPSHFRAHHKLGRSLAREGKLDEAIAHFQWAVRLAPGEKQFRSSLGEAYLRRGDFVAAEMELRQVLEPAFSHAPTLTKLARALIGQGRMDEARAALDEALRLDADNPQAMALLTKLNDKGTAGTPAPP
jgi:protein O-mannosyl-transferase